jgi:hypothetical protein
MFPQNLDNWDNRPIYMDSAYLTDHATRVVYWRFVGKDWQYYLVDVSSDDSLTFFGENGHAVMVNRDGVFFYSKGCSLKISVLVPNMFGRIAGILGIQCSTKRDIYRTPPRTGSTLVRRTENTDFYVLAHIKDQCGLHARKEMEVDILCGETPCTVYPLLNGHWAAACKYPGDESDLMRCEASVNSTIEYLSSEIFAGSCVTLKQIFKALGPALANIVTRDNFLAQLGLRSNDSLRFEAPEVVGKWMKLWDFALSLFTTNNQGKSVIEEYVANYGHANFTKRYGLNRLKEDICREPHNKDFPLDLEIWAGYSNTIIKKLSSTPDSIIEYTGTAIDPDQRACCSPASKCNIFGNDPNERWYDRSAWINGNDCTCGTATDGEGIAFASRLCEDFKRTNCTSEAGCRDGEVCLESNCCGYNVCVSMTECSVPWLVGKKDAGDIEEWEVPGRRSAGRQWM